MIKAPRGTVDTLPCDMAAWNYVEKTSADTARVFGFSEIRTPVFEHTELFERGVGDTTDVVQKEMYTFLDKSDRSITLRPEGTAPTARAYLEHSLYAKSQPVKLFYNITCYRYEKPQAGRLREFHQFGVEVFGSHEPSVDGEIIALAHTIFKNVGITNIKLNINSIGCPVCRKKYNEALISYFKKHYGDLCITCKGRLDKNPMRILDCKSGICKEVSANAPLILDFICGDCKSHFEIVKKYLSKMEIEYSIDPTIVRGLDYYTRTVFEFVTEGIGAKSTICGGGRYDGLVELLGGKPTPGMGFAFGIERVLLVMKEQGITPPANPPADIFIASVGQSEAALSLCHKLRLLDVYAECDLMGRSLKAQMKNADRLNARFSMVLGEDEVSSGKAQMKNMQTGETVVVDINSIKSITNVLF